MRGCMVGGAKFVRVARDFFKRSCKRFGMAREHRARRVGKKLPAARYRKPQQCCDKRRENGKRNSDEQKNRLCAPVSSIIAPSSAAIHRPPEKKIGKKRHKPDQHHRNGRYEHVFIAYMRKLVREHRLKL